MYHNDDNWPRHADGRRKKIGEMTREEASKVFKDACRRIEAEFANPVMQEKLTAILRGANVNQ